MVGCKIRMKYKEYHEKLAEEALWGSLREICLSENIISELPYTFQNLVDIGCGDGYLLYQLSKKNKLNLTGVDLSKKRLQRLKKRVPGIRAFTAEITQLPFKNNEYDTIIYSEVLEHIPDFKKALSELIRISSKNIFITVPNDQPLKKTVCPNCGEEHFVDGHINNFNIKRFKELLKDCKEVKITNIRKFYTIYSYNKVTLKLPVFLRLLLDKFICSLERHISFFKPNYLLIKLVKNEK